MAFGVFTVRHRDWTASNWYEKHIACSLASPSPSLPFLALVSGARGQKGGPLSHGALPLREREEHLAFLRRKKGRQAPVNSPVGEGSLPREAHPTGLPKPAASCQLTAVSRKLAQNLSSPSVGSPLHCSLSQKGQHTLGRGGGERPSTNPLLEITIQQRSWNLGCESLQALPDKLLPPALHSCLLRDNSLKSLSVQVEVSWGGGGGGVLCVGRTLVGNGGRWHLTPGCQKHTLPHATQRHLWKGDGGGFK